MRRLAALLALLFAAPATAGELKVSSDFPGGSAKVEKIDQQSRLVRISPAGTPDRGWVAWWYFKLEGIEKGETLTIDIGGGVWATPDRAAVSLDDKTWAHTEPAKRSGSRAVYRVKVDATEAWFAWGPPFVLKHARELIDAAAKKSEHVHPFELCKTKEGRSVPAMQISFPGAGPKDRLGIWVQARQHAWESGSGWVCRGFTDWLLSDDEHAAALRKKADVYVVPIMDVDNVETGNGGKNQKPHDHNRDWSDKPVWPEVRAAQERIAKLNAAGRFDLFIDLHNPAPGDRQPFFFVSPPELLSARGRQNLDSFKECGAMEITGPLKLGKDRPSGASYDKNWQKISKNWVTKNCANHVVAVTLETSWNTPHSTTAGYRTVGEQLGLAVERYGREARR